MDHGTVMARVHVEFGQVPDAFHPNSFFHLSLQTTLFRIPSTPAARDNPFVHYYTNLQKPASSLSDISDNNGMRYIADLNTRDADRGRCSTPAPEPGATGPPRVARPGLISCGRCRGVVAGPIWRSR